MGNISKYHNFEQGYIILENLKLGGLLESILIEGDELLLKSEFHISLVCIKRLAPLIDKSDTKNIEHRIVNLFVDFIKTYPLDKYQLLNEFRIVKRDDRKSIVVMAKVPNLDKFYELLNQTFNKNLPVQPTHITIYTLQPGRGIGVLSEQELENDTKIVNLPDLQVQMIT